MHSRRVSRALAAAFLLIGLTACSTGWRWSLARAEQYEHANRPNAALTLYDAALQVIPRNDSKLLSAIQTRRGRCLWQLDRPAEAFAAYSKAVEADPANSTARLRLAEIYLAGNAADNAIEQAEVVVKTDPRNPDAWAVIGGGNAALGRPLEAITAFRQSLKIQPSDVHVAVALADVLNRLDQTAEARAVLTKAAADAPRQADAWLALGRLEEQEGNNPAAEAAYRAGIKVDDSREANLRLAQFLQRSARIQEAEEILRKVDRMQPRQSLALPDFELISGHPDKAAQDYVSALSSAVHDSGCRDDSCRASARSAVISRLIEADIAAAQNSSPASLRQPEPPLARARKHLDQYRASLDSAGIAILQSEISLAEGDLATAALHASSAVAIAPSSAAAHYVLGLARYRAGELALARTEWLAALDSDSDYIPARLELAELALSQGAPRDAEQFCVPVVRQEPGNLRALLLYARALAAEKHFDAAASVAHRAVSMDSRASGPHLVLGEIDLGQQRLVHALIEFEQAVLLEPHSREAIDGLTRVYRFGHVTRPMLLHMEEAADRPPRSATLMEVTGRLYADHGWHQEAERCLRRALEIDPGRTTAAEALGRSYRATGEFEAAAQAASATRPEAAAMLAAVRAQASGDVAHAIEQYEFAVRHGERTGVAANNLAWLYAQQGTRLDRALSLARSAHDLQPDSPAVMDTLGIVHMARREYSASVDALELAHRLLLRLDPHDRPELAAQIQQHLEEAYLRAGRSDAAAKLANK